MPGLGFTAVRIFLHDMLWDADAEGLKRNLDDFLSVEELADWIQLKVEEHFTDTDEENENVFKTLDRDKDGERM